jgi:hypothetical protein
MLVGASEKDVSKGVIRQENVENRRKIEKSRAFRKDWIKGKHEPFDPKGRGANAVV